MNKNDVVIRLEKIEDHRAVEELVREAFWNVYRPGCSEHYVIHVLREDPAFVKELDLVRKFRGSTYKIHVSNPDGKEKGLVSLTVNGVKVDGNMLPTPEVPGEFEAKNYRETVSGISG